MIEETWKPIVGYEGLYEISSLGSIRALRRSGRYRGRWGEAVMNFPAKNMIASTSRSGYKYLCLKKPDEPAVKFLLHRLVMAAFVGPPPNGEQVNHRDGDKSNNAVSNLEYCTPCQNVRHCIDVLGKKRGESMSKLKESDVVAIRSDSRLLREIAADYGITLQAIWYIKKRKSWSHVA